MRAAEMSKNNSRIVSGLVDLVSSMFGTKQAKLPPISETLLTLPAHELSKLIKDGNITSAKLCELYIDRIKSVNPFINCVTQERFKDAQEDAKKIDKLLVEFKSGKTEADFSADELELLNSPLLGVPVTVKESIMVKNMRNTAGLYWRRKFTATEDAVVVKNARRYGMIPVCTTNIPECTIFWADCQNKVYGRSLNPYDFNRVTGASSGGEGGLLGAGASVIGIGSDIGGSLRIPAHCCGIFSHKPSPFLVSSEGNYPVLKESRLRMFTLGPMCRYASDLRPLFKCLLRDKDNAKQDTYYKYQPGNIASIRNNIIQKLDEQIDIGKLKIFHFDWNNESKLKGVKSVHVMSEIMQAQQEVIDHFVSKFNCQVEHLNLDKYMRKVLIAWQCFLQCGGTIDRDTDFEEHELEKILGIKSMFAEFVKLPFGLSKHTKEALLTVVIGQAVPQEREKAYALCEKFEKFFAEAKKEVENALGENGVLLMPTLPTIAYKHNVSLVKTNDIRFPSFFNLMQFPVTHATVRLDKKHNMPYGFSIASRPYNDVYTIAVGEEIEQAFDGWTPPTVLHAIVPNSNKITTSAPKVTAANNKSELVANIN